MADFLDTNGLRLLWSKIKALVVGKADKVANSTSGNFASLDSDGNLTDSGYSSVDFVSSSDLSNTPKIVIPSVDGKPSHMTSDEIAGLKVGDVIVSQTLTVDVNFYVTKITGDGNGSIVYAVNVNGHRIVTMTFINTDGTWAYQDSSSLDIATASSTPTIIIPSVDGTIQNMTNDEIASLKIGDIVLNASWMNYTVFKNSGSEILLSYVDNKSIIVISLKKTNGVWGYNRYWSIALTNINSIPNKADKILVSNELPSSGMLSNKVYNLGELQNDTTFKLAAATDNTIMNVWHWTFSTGTTVPAITWPSSITMWADGSAPNVVAYKYYEIKVHNRCATVISADVPQ